MGEDGGNGVKMIHDFGGIVLVQEPQSTAFRSMPENAIRKDHPDLVLPPQLLARTIMSEIAARKVEMGGI